VREKAAMALVDGDNAMGHLVMKRAAEVAIAKARTAGVAWAGVRRSNHAGAASVYARMALDAGMAAMVFAVGSANHMAPWGGTELLLGTNPIAVAIPAFEEPPVVLDMATTVAAFGKVRAAATRGEPMPEGWMVDREGRPLTDPRRANEGFLVPIGGYKGYGLALVIGLLAGSLNGAAMGRGAIDFTQDAASATNTGHAFLAIDPSAFGEAEDFGREVDRVVRELRASEPMPGVERVRVPGDASGAERERRKREGIPVAAGLMGALDRVAEQLEIAPLRTL
jgi:LDH2 family malate/lactate/ureidoglycolate dehydrogenase